MLWRFAAACCHGKFDDGCSYRDGEFGDGRVRRHGKRTFRRRRYGRYRAGSLCGVCNRNPADGLIDGSRIIRRHGWNSARLYRTGRGRPQPPICCAQPECLGALYEFAGLAQYGPAL
jgi:hypothetical protein